MSVYFRKHNRIRAEEKKRRVETDNDQGVTSKKSRAKRARQPNLADIMRQIKDLQDAQALVNEKEREIEISREGEG